MADNNQPVRCSICDLLFENADALSRHMDLRHNIVIPAEQMDFIPQVQYDERGNKKRKPYKQAPYTPSTQYEGY